MYHNIMVPVDLAHISDLGKALKTSADLAKHYQCSICYVGITSPAPGTVAHNPAEFEQKLKDFGQKQADQYGHSFQTKAIVSNDPAIDLNSKLIKTADELGADLIVMASHLPGVTDYIWPSHGGSIASHARASVFVVR